MKLGAKSMSLRTILAAATKSGRKFCNLVEDKRPPHLSKSAFGTRLLNIREKVGLSVIIGIIFLLRLIMIPPLFTPSDG